MCGTGTIQYICSRPPIPVSVPVPLSFPIPLPISFPIPTPRRRRPIIPLLPVPVPLPLLTMRLTHAIRPRPRPIPIPISNPPRTIGTTRRRGGTGIGRGIPTLPPCYCCWIICTINETSIGSGISGDSDGWCWWWPTDIIGGGNSPRDDRVGFCGTLRGPLVGLPWRRELLLLIQVRGLEAVKWEG